MFAPIRAVTAGLSIAVLSAVSFSDAALAAKQADEICRDARLTRMEKDLCTQQVAAAQPLDEQKQIQAKFKKRADERGEKSK